jgi:dynein heavy chain
MNLNNYFTYSLYENVCRSLFEKHKLLFSFLLCNKILAARDEMDSQEWRYLLVGPQGDLGMEKNPTTWIAETSWSDIYLNFAGLSGLPAFNGLKDHFMNNYEQYKPIYDSN